MKNQFPATLTSTGRVVGALVTGPANALTGLARWREVWWRLRRVYDRYDSVRLMVAMWCYGVMLSGPPVGRDARTMTKGTDA